MNEQETIADIIAEMRAPHDEICEKCHEEPNESCPFCGDPDGCNSPDYGRWPGVMTQFADRAEAAHKREIEKLNSVIQATVSHSDAEIDRLRREAKKLRRQIGDAAKLREALEFSIRQMSNAICDNTFGDDVVYLVGCMKTCIDRMKSALAAPPRNCDRFSSYTEARAEWWKTEVLPRVEGVVSGAESPFDEWLFALSTQKEGGAR